MQGGKGTILVTTLWILALLSLLALGIGIRTGVDIKLISFFLNGSKARYLAEAGLRKAIILLESDNDKRVDSLKEIWSCGFDFEEEEFVLKEIPLGEGSFTVCYEFGKDGQGNPIYLYGASDEEAKLNVNELDADRLAKLPNFTPEIVDAILDWRDEDSLARLEGAEDDFYEELDNPYECKDAKFSAPEELMAVKGVTREIYEGVKDIITVYGDTDKININTALEKVLVVLMDAEFEEVAGKVVRYRNGPDEIPGTEDDKVFTDTQTITAQLSGSIESGGLDLNERNYLDSLIQKKKYFGISSNTFRVISRGELKNRRIRKSVEAVVRRNDKGSNPLFYHEY